MAESTLTDEMLARLRAVMEAADRGPRQTAPKALIGQLAAAAGAPVPITIDFAATATLGHPLVVVQQPPAPPAWIATLSKREREVAALLAEGLRNKEIAARLFISVATVKDHVHRILEKSGLEGRAAVAAAWAITPASGGWPTDAP